MEDELANMQRNATCTWEIVKRPTEVNVVESKWVFAIKRNQGDGKIRGGFIPVCLIK